MDTALLHEVIGGHDPRDSTSIDRPVPRVVDAVRRGQTEGVAGMKIGVVRELGGEGYQAGVIESFEAAVAALTDAGAEIVEVSCPHFEYALAAYYLILPSECSSNLARFDAMRYGLRVGDIASGGSLVSAEDVMAATRGAGFGPEVKRRIILGTYALSAGYYDAYYGSALKVRTLIRQDFENAYAQADVLISPASPVTAFKLGEKVDDPMAMYLNDLATIPGSLAGIPAMSVPSGIASDTGLPVGLQIMGPALGEEQMYRVAAAFEAGYVATTRPHRRRCGARVGGIGMTTHGDRIDGVRRGDRALRPGDGARGARRTGHRHQDVLRLLDHLRCRAEHPGLPDLPGAARRDAGDQPARGGVRDPDRSGAELPDRILVPDVAEELLLPGHAEELPDLAVRRADRFRRLPRRGLVDGSGKIFRIEIERAHMEEDTGKSLHVGGSTGRIQGAEYSLLDYNRAGVPLVEIVTKPIFGTKEKAPAVARAYVGALRDLLASLDVSDVRMDQGSLRCDANLSLTPAGNPVMGTRTETKNVNSLRSVERAVRYEITRQGARLAAGQTVKQETRHFDESTGTTNPGRSKETAEDYRYFPEPDLVPIAPDPAWVESIRAALPELPWVRRARLQESWGLTDLEMRDLLAADAVDLVEATVAAGASPAEARSWWSAYLGQQANVLGVSLPELAITPGPVGPGHRAGLRRCAERQDRPHR